MGNASSSSKKNKITEADKAILALRTQRRRIEDHKKRVEIAIDRENAVARELIAAGRKDRALLALKKRQLNAMQLQKLDVWLLNVESSLADVESAASLVSLHKVLKQGTDALKQLQKEVSLEDVDQLMQDTKEAVEYQERLQEMLGESWTGQDETAALEALEDLERELAETAKAQIEAELPAVPTQTVQAPETQGPVVQKAEPERVAMLA